MTASNARVLHAVLPIAALLLALLLGFLLWTLITTGSQEHGLAEALGGGLVVAGILAILVAGWTGGAQAPVAYTAPTWVSVRPMYDRVDSPVWRRAAARIEHESTLWAVLGLVLFALGATFFVGLVPGTLAVVCGLGILGVLGVHARRGSLVRG